MSSSSFSRDKSIFEKVVLDFNLQKSLATIKHLGGNDCLPELKRCSAIWNLSQYFLAFRLTGTSKFVKRITCHTCEDFYLNTKCCFPLT